MMKVGESMKEASLKKFTVALEVANFVSYLKYIDKRENHAVNTLSNAIYDLIQREHNVSNSDIKNLVQLHSNLFVPGQLNEEKFNYYFNAITSETLNEKDIYDTSDVPFIIQLPKETINRFDNQVITNLFTDMYKEIYFLLDVRYYSLETKYIFIDFDLIIQNNNLVLKSDNPIYTDYFLEKYTLKDTIQTLGLEMSLGNKSSYYTTSYSDELIENAFLFDKKIVFDFLMESYETSNFVFINSSYLKTLEIDIEELIIQKNKPKLLVILETNNNNYFNANLNQRQDRIEKRGNNTILFVSENLIREACGKMDGIIMMNHKTHLSLNKISADYDFIYLTKVQSQVKLIKLIIDTYFERNSQLSDLKQFNCIHLY